MYPPKFNYYRADSVSEAVTLLQTHSGAKLLAGGHSLLPVMKLRLADPGTIIDIGRLAELRGITRQSGVVQIGAMTHHATIAESAIVPAALSQAAGWIGDQMVRNRGTIGGNLAHADPAADLPTVLLALDATLHIAGPAAQSQPEHLKGKRPIRMRSVKADDFFTGFFTTTLAEDEILTTIEIPTETAGMGSAYAKLFNPASRFALIGAAASLTIDQGVCTAARVAVGGLTPTAVRIPTVEDALIGRMIDNATILVAVKRVADGLDGDLIGDIHASADYRRQVAPIFVSKALDEALARAT